MVMYINYIPDELLYIILSKLDFDSIESMIKLLYNDEKGYEIIFKNLYPKYYHIVSSISGTDGSKLINYVYKKKYHVGKNNFWKHYLKLIHNSDDSIYEKMYINLMVNKKDMYTKIRELYKIFKKMPKVVFHDNDLSISNDTYIHKNCYDIIDLLDYAVSNYIIEENASRHLKMDILSCKKYYNGMIVSKNAYEYDEIFTVVIQIIKMVPDSKHYISLSANIFNKFIKFTDSIFYSTFIKKHIMDNINILEEYYSDAVIQTITNSKVLNYNNSPSRLHQAIPAAVKQL